MEFIVSRNALLRALKHARLAIQRTSKGEVPKLFKNFVFTFPDSPQESTMTVHASNGEIWISETILLDKAPVPDASSSGSSIRPFAIWYGDLLRSIKSLEEQPLQFIVGEYQLTVKHACGSFRLPLNNSCQEFLNVRRPCPDIETCDGYSIPYEAPGLRSILSRSSFAMAHDELRQVMNGVHVNLTESFADYISSDGHRLVRVRKAPVASPKGPLTLFFGIPAPIVKILLRILPVTGDVEVEYQKEKTKEKTSLDLYGKKEKYTVVERNAAARIVINDNLTLTFLPIEGRYPNYLNVIPDHYNYEMTVDRQQLIKSLDRLSIFQETTGLVTLNISKDSLRLDAVDKYLEMDGEENLPCECNDDTMLPMKIGMEMPALLSILKALSSEKVILRIIDPAYAIVILPVTQPDVEHITMLIMPMLLND